MTIIESIASWSSGLKLEEIPPRVLEVARNQVLSVMGAIHAGAGCAGGKSVIETVKAMGVNGPCGTYPGGQASLLMPAVLQNASLAMALDYDDYLFLAHTGHSAVCVPLAVGETVGADAATVLVAQVAANEIAGRLGGSVVLGPHNGQMWAHVHLIGAAAAASRVLGLNEDQTADAMGIALAEPVYSLFPGFMGPQSKLLVASVPSITGTLAALLASNGMTGPRAILEDPQGFWAHFSFVPVPFMMTGLGRAWVTDTIAFKPYPGCAYIDTAMDALFDVLERFEKEKGRPVEPAEIKDVKVEASLLTIAMNAMASGYMDEAHLSPTNINFSMSVSIAIGLLAGRLTGAELTDPYLEENRREILALASRVQVEHSARLSVRFIKSIDEAVDLEAMLAELDWRGVLKARHNLREHMKRVATMGPRGMVEAWQSLDIADRTFLKSLISLRGFFAAPAGYDLGRSRLEDLRMPFGARVHVTLRDGTLLEAEKHIPKGGPGDPGRLDVAADKFVREASPFLGEEQAKKAVEVVRDYENGTLGDIRGALTPAG
ncbi:MAG: MmgE/PrpD family protein [Candidatus Geothermincolia bacterium]